MILSQTPHNTLRMCDGITQKIIEWIFKMYFEKDGTSLEILTGAYTENPEGIYISKEVWLNSLNCVTIYYKENPHHDEALFEELFQAQDVVLLYQNIHQLLTNKIQEVHFQTTYEELRMDILKQDDAYQVKIYIVNRAEEDIEETFSISLQQLSMPHQNTYSK